MTFKIEIIIHKNSQEVLGYHKKRNVDYLPVRIYYYTHILYYRMWLYAIKLIYWCLQQVDFHETKRVQLVDIITCWTSLHLKFFLKK